jgi:hypothetical protein
MMGTVTAIRIDGVETAVAACASQLAALSRLFSSAVFREMAGKGRSRLFARLAPEAGVLGHSEHNARVRDAFDCAFAMLQRSGQRDEYVYKAALAKRILLGRHNLNTACMLTEFRAGACKADVTILNGTTTVYEIKSERDSLSRLDRQLANYREVFASVVVIACEKHVPSLLRSLPSDVGIMSLTNRHQIRTLREPLDRPERISPVAVLESLRTDEAKAILSCLGAAVPQVPNTALRTELRRCFATLRAEDVHGAMLQVLKRTRDLKPLAEFLAQLPGSLHAAALSIPLRKADYGRMVQAVNVPMEHALAWS